MRIVGVDPGATGALALLVNGNLCEIVDMPIFKVRRGKTDKAEVDGYALADTLRRFAPDVIYLEQVGGMTGQSPSAAFNFGRAAGAVEYAAKALAYKVVLIHPSTWKRAMRLLKSGKDGARAAATGMWPECAALFRRKGDDGRAEAALLAEYGRKQQGETDGFFG